MGSVNMSDKSSQPDSSDDLIAQLAQLMADDAQSSRSNISSSGEVSEPAISLEGVGTVENNVKPSSETHDSVLDALSGSRQAFAIDQIKEKSIIGELQKEAVEITASLAEPRATFNEARENNQTLSEAGSVSVNSDPIADLISAQLEAEEVSSHQKFQQNEIINEELENAALEEGVSRSQLDSFEIPPVFGLASNEAQAESLVDDIEPLNSEEPRETTNIVNPVLESETQGLETTPQAPQSLQNTAPADNITSVDNDPIIDIENLIGEAVRAGIPQNYEADDIIQTPQVDVDSAARAAQDTIMAATADTNFETNAASDLNIANHAADEQEKPSNLDEAYIYSKPKKSFISSVLGPSLAGVLLLGIGYGLFWFFTTDKSQSPQIPVLSADESPQKIAPVKTQDASSDNTQSVVFDEIAGGEKIAQNEQIVSRDESVNANSNTVSRIIPTDASSSDSNLANIRVVRTVTVRPDGTIVNGDSARAGANALPVDRPNVPQLPEGAIVAVPDSSVASATAAPTDVASIGVAPTDVAPTDVAPTDVALTVVPADVVSVASAPTPQVRPANLELANTVPAVPIISTPIVSVPNVNSNSTAVDLIALNASQNIAPTSASSAVVISSLAPAYVQLSSQRSEQIASISLNELKNRYSSILESGNLEIQRADLGEKGIYYRVRLPADSINSANQICTNIKQAGGECFVRTN